MTGKPIPLTPYQIAARAGDAPTRLGSIRIINRLFRARDDSDAWPVSGKFNATERAIRRLRRLQVVDGDGLEYALCLHGEIGRIVNQAV
jgi:hypothetical protein